ncbi:hypothetical protein VPH35_072690 [Triticum aestivum]
MNEVAQWHARAGEAAVRQRVHIVHIWPVVSSCWLVTNRAGLRHGFARRAGRDSAGRKNELHPACEVRPVSLCSPTAHVCLCPVHGRSVCGARVHMTATCGVNRSQARSRMQYLHTFAYECAHREVQAMQMVQPQQHRSQLCGVPCCSSPSVALLVEMPPLLHVCTKATTHLSSQVILV